MADKKDHDRMRDKSKVPSNRSGRQLSQQEICVGEELKIAVNVAVDRFINNESDKELEFPSSLTANERAYVHRYCKDLGLITKSKGKGNKRYLTVYKVVEKSVTVSGRLSLSRSSTHIINSLLQDLPVTSRDKHELSGQKLHKGIINEQGKILARENRLVLGNAPHIPPDAKETELRKKAKDLPIYSFQEDIVEAISKNQVVMIAGDTGSGKTTQVSCKGTLYNLNEGLLYFMYVCRNAEISKKFCYLGATSILKLLQETPNGHLWVDIILLWTFLSWKFETF